VDIIWSASAKVMQRAMARRGSFCLLQKAQEIDLLNEFEKILLGMVSGKIIKRNKHYWVDFREFCRIAQGDTTIETALDSFVYTVVFDKGIAYAHIVLKDEKVPEGTKVYSRTELFELAKYSELWVGGKISTTVTDDANKK
jgi:hypothetical protein